jgi:hypothetical protein
MDTELMGSKLMNDDLFEVAKKEIIKTYFFHSTKHDPILVEIMKLSALADVQKRFDVGELW